MRPLAGVRSVAVDAAPPARARTEPAAGLAEAARRLLAALRAEPAGRSSASVYETARLVSLAPWVPLHEQRVTWLLTAQRADGGWGGHGGYFLVPTLSAVEALLALLRRRDPAGPGPALLARAARDGLRRLHDAGDTPPPDLPATDLIVPALHELLADHLAALAGAGHDELAPWCAAGAPAVPGAADRRRLDRVRGLLAAGGPLPDKLAHALEVGGRYAYRAAGLGPVGPGTVGASPAATAAWIGTPVVAGEPGTTYLADVARRHGGPVPCAAPITVFERSWVLSTLARAGVPVAVPPALTLELAAALGPAGTPTGPGLPADADTTSVTVYALGRLGHPVDPSCLWAYDTGEQFCTWPGEDGASVTTNAHVLEALGDRLGYGDREEDRLPAAVRRLTAWLVARQEPDGSWSDRWHASPYYATSCVVAALAAYAPDPAARAAVDRATAWLLASQRDDGSWGRWAGTAEETAYSVLALTAARPDGDSAAGRAARWGAAQLSRLEERDGNPPLWHDKDLYRPELIAQAAVLAARWVTGTPAPEANRVGDTTPTGP